MTREEVAVVLALLQANWSREFPFELTDQQVAVWMTHLADIPPASGLATANDLIASSAHFPTVGEFRGAWESRQRREWHQRPRSLDESRSTPESAVEHLKAMRDRLRAKSGSDRSPKAS